jgi:hypothetical protein
MEPDPAYAAERLKLVDDHRPETLRMVGAWRWPCLQKHRERVRDILLQGEAVDFGGAAGPIGYGASVVDYGAPIKRLADLDFQPMSIFSSHTLEHLDDLNATLDEMVTLLKPGGFLLAHVPSWRVEHWRSGKWPHHNYTFFLTQDRLALETVKDSSWRALDAAFTTRGLAILLAHDHCGSILVVGQK